MNASNEAAERLREWILEHPLSVKAESKIRQLDEALAAERRATVERIRAATKDINVWPVTLDRILDEELRTADDSAKAAR